MGYNLKQRTTKNISRGKYYPLGAQLHKDGVNFAIFSKHAKEVFLLLFDEPNGYPTDIVQLEKESRHVWHVFLHEVKAGQLYGYKIRGEYIPSKGMRFNENKLLIDPYAKAFTGKFKNTDHLLFGYDPYSSDKDLVKDDRDNTLIVPKSIVIDDSFDWQNDSPPDIPFEKLVLYEVHVKGFTAHTSSGVRRPGTYLGFIEKIPYLKELGINAVEILPVHEFYIEDFLLQKGLTNYWGYNTIGFFAPEISYSTQSFPGCQVNEFKTFVRELHKAGIEVILDVVYNHSGEGNELGPTLCLKGIDNLTYYSLTGPPEEPGRYYNDFAGCGNSINLANPYTMRFVMDSLRYWVSEMHVDGFRFDLATALGREGGKYEKCASFFDSISQDPLLNRTKIIAEPWDMETYQLGNFPVDWAEWNGKFRDTVRQFVKGDSGQIKQLGWRLTGSADLYGNSGRSPYNSINFMTCHDGFTLNDLVSYNIKHNEANLEKNEDGARENFSWNCGVEGETADQDILQLRKKLIKNFFCLLFFSMGTPMIAAGDEFMRTQKGNNNAYCQDNEFSWHNWEYVKKNNEIFNFCKKTLAFRKKHTILQRRIFFSGKDGDGDGTPDIQWFGKDLKEPLWDTPESRVLCYQLDGGEEESEMGDYYISVLLNSDIHPQSIQLSQLEGKNWYRIIDTSLPLGEDFSSPKAEKPLESPFVYLAHPRSVVVFLGK